MRILSKGGVILWWAQSGWQFRALCRDWAMKPPACSPPQGRRGKTIVIFYFCSQPQQDAQLRNTDSHRAHLWDNISHYHPGMLGIIWISWIPTLLLFPNLQMVQVNLSGSRNSVAMNKLLVWTSGAQLLSDVIWVPCVAAEMGRADLKYELIPSGPLRLERQGADKEIQNVPMGLIRTYPKEMFF